MTIIIKTIISIFLDLIFPSGAAGGQERKNGKTWL